MILAGVLLKMGTYGLLRFAFPLFPSAAAYFAPALATLAVIGIIYGALVAMVQPDMKKLVAYSSVSHLGFVVLGIFALNVQGMQGAVYQMLNHGVSTGGALPDRRHALRAPPHPADRGVRRAEGRHAAPGRRVPADHAVVDRPAGSERLRRRVPDPARRVRWDPRFAAFAASGVILSAVYMLWMFQRVNYGPVTHDENLTLPDLTVRERWVIIPIVAVAIFMGVFPGVFLRPMQPSVDRLLQRVSRETVAQAPAGQAPPGTVAVRHGRGARFRRGEELTCCHPSPRSFPSCA